MFLWRRAYGEHKGVDLMTELPPRTSQTTTTAVIGSIGLTVLASLRARGLKDTALLSVIGLAEITRRSSEMFGKKFNITPFVVGAVCYLIVTIPLMRLVQYVNKRLSVSD